MKRKITLGTALSLVLVVTVLAVSITLALSYRMFHGTDAGSAQRQALCQKIRDVDQIVRENYLGEIDEQALQDAVAGGYVAGIGDRYSAYLTAEENQARDEKNEGKSYGIGVTCTRHPQTGEIYIVLVHEASPAQKAGLVAGDRIVQVDGDDVKQIGYDAAVERIQGEQGTTCELTVAREDGTFSCSVVRDDYETTSVTYRTVGEVGVIQIHTFVANTDEQFSHALQALQQQKITGLVIDLRGNLGGTIASAEAILDMLLPEGTLYTTVYRSGETQAHRSDEKHIDDLPMAVLVDENTASASELFAAAMQDFGAAKLVGTKTYGKGVMQRTYPLSDGSAVLLTFARFESPKGTDFNGVGLTPDVAVELSQEQKENFVLLGDADDPQLQAALRQIGAQ